MTSAKAHAVHWPGTALVTHLTSGSCVRGNCHLLSPSLERGTERGIDRLVQDTFHTRLAMRMTRSGPSLALDPRPNLWQSPAATSSICSQLRYGWPPLARLASSRLNNAQGVTVVK